MATRLKFGLLLPHFGVHGSVERCLEGSKKAERYGFDSVWVRDHIVFKPNGIEGNDNTHIEGLLLLSSVAAVTTKLTLGTAMLICHRHPIHLAQLFGTLSTISKGQLIMGMGLGGFPHEFAAAGLPTALHERANLARINVEICRRLWAGEKVSYKGDYFEFDNVQLRPAPVKPIPIWAGGTAPAACRRAVEYCDGWMPARITLRTFKKRIDYIRELSKQAGRLMLTTAIMPYASMASDRKTALEHIDVEGLIEETNKIPNLVEPTSGRFSTLQEINGVLLAGTPADIIRETRAYEEAGADHVVYDLRLRYADWYEQIEILGDAVLPALRAQPLTQ